MRSIPKKSPPPKTTYFFIINLWCYTFYINSLKSIYDDEPIGMCFHLIIHNLTRASFAAYAVYTDKFLFFFHFSSLVSTLFTAFSISLCWKSPEMNIPMDFFFALLLLFAFCVKSAKIMMLSPARIFCFVENILRSWRWESNTFWLWKHWRIHDK